MCQDRADRGLGGVVAGLGVCARMSLSARTGSGDGERLIPHLIEPRYSQSLERGIAILQWFTVERPVLGVAEIADGLGMANSTTHRYVSTLAALGFLERTAERRYRLSLRVLRLGMSALSSTGLREHAQVYLEELRQRTRCTASIAVLDGSDVLYVDRVSGLRGGEWESGLDIRAGSRFPAYCMAPGKVLLAGLPKQERRELMGGVELRRHGTNTITTKRALWAEIEHVRDEGVAVDDEELAAGLVAISAPVLDMSAEVVAAASLEAPVQSISLSELVESFLHHLVVAADLISGRLGYRRAGEVNK